MKDLADAVQDGDRRILNERGSYEISNCSWRPVATAAQARYEAALLQETLDRTQQIALDVRVAEISFTETASETNGVVSPDKVFFQRIAWDEGSPDELMYFAPPRG